MLMLLARSVATGSISLCRQENRISDHLLVDQQKQSRDTLRVVRHIRLAAPFPRDLETHGDVPLRLGRVRIVMPVAVERDAGF